MSRRGWTTYRRALSLSPGILDAALSSLAGFAASLYAVRFLDASELGAFALYLSASVVGGLFPHHLLLLPSQIAALELPAARRPLILAPTLVRGAALAAMAMPFVGVSGLVILTNVAQETLLALAAGAVALTALAPMQDHVRSVLYLADQPQRAAVLSLCHFVTAVSALGALHLAGTSAAWVPFSAMAAGYAGSLAAGLVLASVPGPGDPAGLPPTLHLLRAGRPLLPSALLQEATIFAAGAALVALASAATLGTAEAARVVSRPVQALSLGISRSLAPRLMEAGRARSPEGARSALGLYVTAVGLAGLAYLLVAGWSYPLSPFVELLPAAYEEDGLVAVFIVATVVGAIAQVPRAILLGASQGKAILLITTLASAVRLGGVVLLATAIGAFALPAAQIAAMAVAGWAGARATIGLMKKA